MEKARGGRWGQRPGCTARDAEGSPAALDFAQQGRCDRGSSAVRTGWGIWTPGGRAGLSLGRGVQRLGTLSPLAPAHLRKSQWWVWRQPALGWGRVLAFSRGPAARLGRILVRIRLSPLLGWPVAPHPWGLTLARGPSLPSEVGMGRGYVRRWADPDLTWSPPWCSRCCWGQGANGDKVSYSRAPLLPSSPLLFPVLLLRQLLFVASAPCSHTRFHLTLLAPQVGVESLSSSPQEACRGRAGAEAVIRAATGRGMTALQ